jgi:hypothetical protein
VRLRIRDFFNDAEPDAFALRAAAKDEFLAGDVEPHARFEPRFNGVASQAAYLQAGQLFFGVHGICWSRFRIASGPGIPANRLRSVVAGTALDQATKQSNMANLYCTHGFVAVLDCRNKWKESGKSPPLKTTLQP